MEPLLERREVEGLLFGIADIRDDLRIIRRILEEEGDDGEAAEDDA